MSDGCFNVKNAAIVEGLLNARRGQIARPRFRRIGMANGLAMRMIMKTAMAIAAALLGFGIGRCAYGQESLSPLRAVDRLFDTSNARTLGITAVPGKHATVYRASENGPYRFSHHPGLAAFGGCLYCSWSSGFAHEDRPGQRVVYARSVDGVRWSSPRVLAEPGDKRNRCIAAGFHVAGDTLVAYYTVCREYPVHNLFHQDNGLFARTSRDGQNWSEPRRVAAGFFIEGPRRLPDGRLLLAGEVVGELWKTERARMRLLYSDDPTGLAGWKVAAIDPKGAQPGGIKVFGYTEPCPYVRPDGAIVSPFRNSTGFLYASVSQDNGVSWTVPRQTNFPDSRARFCTGRLPDGTVFLINNPGPGPNRRAALGNRGLLTIALSNDGIVFDRAWLVRAEPTAQRFRGKGKSDGWQYPHALVWNDALYIVYSVNKEDIRLTRIALTSLGD